MYYFPIIFNTKIPTFSKRFMRVWDIADIAVGFIVIPNMIALLALNPKFFKLFREYKP